MPWGRDLRHEAKKLAVQVNAPFPKLVAAPANGRKEVASGDGTHGNPDISTFVMLSTARGQDEFTIHLTNREDRLVNFFEEERQKGKRYKVAFRDPNEVSVKVNLGDTL